MRNQFTRMNQTVQYEIELFKTNQFTRLNQTSYTTWERVNHVFIRMNQNESDFAMSYDKEYSLWWTGLMNQKSQCYMRESEKCMMNQFTRMNQTCQSYSIWEITISVKPIHLNNMTFQYTTWQNDPFDKLIHQSESTFQCNMRERTV